MLKKTLIIIVLCATWIVTNKLIQSEALTHIAKAVITYRSDADALLFFKTSSSFIPSPYEEWKTYRQSPIHAGKERTVAVDLGNRLANTLSLETSRAIALSIKRIEFKSYLAKSISLDAEQLSTYFNHADTGTQINLINHQLNLSTQSDRLILNFNRPIRFKNRLLEWGLPSILSLLLLLYLTRSGPRHSLFSKLQNPTGHVNNIYRTELDGLRGIAALLVLAEHTWSPFLGAGRTGVWLFFILSGYLLSQPFVNNPERAIDRRFMSRYILRRVARIFPMFCFVVIIFFGIPGKYDKLFNYLFMIHLDGHLWTIPQELVFYFILPILVISLFLLGKAQASLRSLSLTILSAVFLFKPHLFPIKLMALGRQTTALIGWFLLGMLVSYLNPQNGVWQARITEYSRNVLSWVGIALFVLLLVFSAHITAEILFDAPRSLVLPIRYGPWFGFACALLIILILLTPNTHLSKLISWRVFRAVGIVGYSYYLLHPFVIYFIRGLGDYYFNFTLVGLPMMLIGGISTWFVAVATYIAIERPFIVGKHGSRLPQLPK